MTSRTLKTLRIIAFCAFVIGLAYGNLFSQQINAIQSKCPSPNQLTKSQVRALANGNIVYTPCSVGASVFTGAVDFSGATIASSFTDGSVLFAGVGGAFSENNAGFFYSSASNTLRLGESNYSSVSPGFTSASPSFLQTLSQRTILRRSDDV